jgi:hypothetical protein
LGKWASIAPEIFPRFSSQSALANYQKCFIGYRTLQRAIALYKKTYPGGSEDEFVIEWKPYFIDQVAPETSVLINGAHASPILCTNPHIDTTRLMKGE